MNGKLPQPLEFTATYSLLFTRGTISAVLDSNEQTSLATLDPYYYTSLLDRDHKLAVQNSIADDFIPTKAQLFILHTVQHLQRNYSILSKERSVITVVQVSFTKDVISHKNFDCARSSFILQASSFL